jgi:hypothetical protein
MPQDKNDATQNSTKSAYLYVIIMCFIELVAELPLTYPDLTIALLKPVHTSRLNLNQINLSIKPKSTNQIMIVASFFLQAMQEIELLSLLDSCEELLCCSHSTKRGIRQPKRYLNNSILGWFSTVA